MNFVNEELIKKITEICFRENNELQKADLLLLFGSTSSINEMYSELEPLLSKKLIDTLIITGGYRNSINNSEALYIFEKLKPIIHPEIKVVLEQKSTNTLENVTEALKLVDFKSLNKIYFSCKSFAAGRCYLTLLKHTQGVKILQRSFITKNVDNINWFTSQIGVSIVIEELNKIHKYSNNGDIALIESIDKSTIEVLKELSLT